MPNIEDTLNRIVQEESARRNPELAAHHFSLGEEALQQRKYKEARDHFQVAINWDQEARYFEGLWKALLGLGEDKEAEEMFGEAIKLNPNNATLFFEHGRVLDRIGRTSLVIESYENAIRLGLDTAEVHYLLGLTLSKHGEGERAITELEQAIKMGREDSSVHIQIGSILEKLPTNHLEHLKEATHYYKRALQIEPQSTDARVRLASTHNELGNILSIDWDLERRIGEYKEAVRLDPNNPSYLLNLRRACTKKINLLFQRENLGIKMVEIPFGSFMMGIGEIGWVVTLEKLVGGHADWASPTHLVQLDGFYMSDTPITKKQYKQIIGVDPFPAIKDDNYPATRVSWYDAVKFCNILSIRLGLEPCYREGDWICSFSRNGIRLPTEAEWEYACRAGTTTKYYTGNIKGKLEKAMLGGLGSRIRKVKEFIPNSWGLYDMHGNAEEWCNDYYGADYYKNSPCNNPTGPDSSTYQDYHGNHLRVLRGRASAGRRFESPRSEEFNFGFRIVCRL